MLAAIIYNPISGRGRSQQTARSLQDRLSRGGCDVRMLQTELAPIEQWLTPVLAEVDAAAVLGGDGAMRMVAGGAIETETPLYHLPLGTENLFAREFGMTDDLDVAADAMTARRVKYIDVGIANGRTFLLMASIGLDAEVVADLGRRRRTSISHWSYLMPVVRQTWRWRPTSLTITVDGERRVDARPGMVIVGNSRQYGWRLDPAVHAMMDDGLFDCVFFPTRTRLGLARWAVASFRGRHVKQQDLVYVKGRHVQIESAPACAFQIDGDVPPPPPVADGSGYQTAVERLEIEVRPGVLPLAVPG